MEFILVPLAKFANCWWWPFTFSLTTTLLPVVDGDESILAKWNELNKSQILTYSYRTYLKYRQIWQNLVIQPRQQIQIQIFIVTVAKRLTIKKLHTKRMQDKKCNAAQCYTADSRAGTCIIRLRCISYCNTMMQRTVLPADNRKQSRTRTQYINNY